jgi:benzoyl-CoA reductase/2-hydroxyglutaryl-CoA dehydratase subunit BcrC/BadD/HgdB
MEVVKASVTMPREEFNGLLKGLLEEIRHRSSLKNGQLRLMISGSIMDRPEFIKAIEDLGVWVVTDDLCMGTRIFWNLVDTSLDPMAGLAQRYLCHPPCARMRPYTLRLNHIIDMVREFKVHGVIYETIKFCDIFGAEKPMIKEDLLTSNIPILELDIEYGGSSAAGQIRTRVEAFIEMLEKGRKG